MIELRSLPQPLRDPFTDALADCKDPGEVGRCLLAKALNFANAPMGNVQLMAQGSRHLEIVAQKGLEENFLAVFARVNADGQSVCAQALKRGDAVTVEDVESERSGLSSHAAVFAKAGIRAVQSIPLISSAKEMVGMLSTHFPRKTQLSAAELITMRRFATQAANRLGAMSPALPARRPSKSNLQAWGKRGFKSKS